MRIGNLEVNNPVALGPMAGVTDLAFRTVCAQLGANITVNGKTAMVTGVDELYPAPLQATDLRAGAAMVIAGLMANGTTEITNIHYVERGYENLVEKITAIGGDIRKEGTN